MFDDEDPLRGYVPSPGARLPASYFSGASPSIARSGSSSSPSIARSAATTIVHSASRGGSHSVDRSRSTEPETSNIASAQKLFASPFRSVSRQQQAQQHQHHHDDGVSPEGHSPVEQLDHDADEDEQQNGQQNGDDGDCLFAPPPNNKKRNGDVDTTDIPHAEENLSLITQLSRLSHLGQDVLEEAQMMILNQQQQQQYPHHYGGENEEEDPVDQSVFGNGTTTTTAAHQQQQRHQSAELDFVISFMTKHAKQEGHVSALRDTLTRHPSISTELAQQLKERENIEDEGSSPFLLLSQLHFQQQLLLSESSHRCHLAQLNANTAVQLHDKKIAHSSHSQASFAAAATKTQDAVEAMLRAIAEAQRSAAALEQARTQLELSAQERAAAAATLRQSNLEKCKEEEERESRRAVVYTLASLHQGGQTASPSLKVRRGATIPDLVGALRRPVLQSTVWASALTNLGLETAADLEFLRTSSPEWESCLLEHPLLKALLRKVEITLV